MIVKRPVTDCTHCGLTVPQGLLDPLSKEQFCCSGCRSAWQLIHANGLDAFYTMFDDVGNRPTNFNDAADHDHVFADFDQPGFLEKFATIDDDGNASITLAISGLHCAACVWLIEKLPAMVPGTIEANVNWSRANVTVAWHTQTVNLSQIAQALSRLGYHAQPVGKGNSFDLRQLENRKQLAQIGIAAAAAGNNMLIAAALYLGMFSYMSGSIETLLRLVSCLVGMVSFLGPGRVFLRGAINSLSAWTPHMDLPIALALTVGSLAGVVNTVRGTGEIYFDSLSVLIFLLLTGRWIQYRQQYRAADAVELLYSMTPRRAWKRVNGSFVEVAAEDLETGDVIQVRPGNIIAADGIVQSGQSNIDESILTGESRPVRRTDGDVVFAGTKNNDGLLIVDVTAVDEQTRIHNVIQLVEDAAANKPQIVQWANRIGGYFVIAVILLSFATLIGWLSISPERAVDRVVALLVVACPCALAMATPLAISVALGRLAKNKILVKAGDVLQQMIRPGAIWLDKTGTLTNGQLNISGWAGDQSWLPVVARIEKNFNHPVARAFCEHAEYRYTKKRHDDAVDVEIHDIKPVAGGVLAMANGQQIAIGNRALLHREKIDIGIPWVQREADILAAHQSPCWIAVDRQIVAVASLGDKIRPEAKQVVGELKQAGWQVGILSGDHRVVVAAVADELGIGTFHAEVNPEGKLNIIEQSRQQHATVVMVGDGVNDSGALAAATVGISVCGGAEASLAAAPVYFAENGLSGIRVLMETARSCSRTMTMNFAVSLAYNVVGVTLAMAGILNPLVAAILMPLSSITVITLSLTAARGPGGSRHSELSN